MKKHPLVTIAVPVYNEEENIRKVLESIFSQDYPRRQLDVVVVDDGSTDRTLHIAKEFPVRIIESGEKDAEISKLKAFKIARGEYFTILDADMRYRGRDWFKKMLKPMIENPSIPQAATKYYRHPNESTISQYLSLNPMQLDPIYRFFASSFKDVIVEKRKGYYITEYSADKIPPQNAGIYRKSIMRKIYKNKNAWMDLDHFCYLVEMGYTKFAYVPDAGYFHFHAESFTDLINKRLRNLKKVYLPSVKERKFTWFDLSTPGGIFKVLLWVFIANLFIPIFLLSLLKTVRKQEPLYLLDAPVALILTDVLLFNMLKESSGRGLIIRGIKSNF